LCSNGLTHLSVRDCNLLIKYFDIDLDQALNYTEFMQMILPCDDLRLRSEASQRHPKGLDDQGRLPEPVERMMVEFLEKEISLHMRMEVMKHELNSRFDWNISSAFS
jgi:hypothetical protein